MKELRAVNTYFLKNKKTLILGVLITIIAQIFLVISPRFVGDSVNILEKFIQNEISITQAKEELIEFFCLLVGVTVISGFFTFLMRQTLVVMSRNIEFDMKNDIFKQYERLSMHFFKTQRTGDLMSRISEDVGKVRMYVGPAVMYSLNAIVRMTVVLVQMFLISPELSLYALIPVPILMIVMIKVVAIVKKRSLKYQEMLSEMSSFSQEVFSGIYVIKSYALESEYQEVYNRKTTQSKEVFMRRVKASALVGPMMVGIIGLSNILVLYIGATMYINKQIEEIGIIVQFIMYVNLLTWPIASFGWITSMVQEADAAQKRINEFMNINPAITDIAEPKPYHFEKEICFENVDFKYEDTNIQALKDINFCIEKGETIAILGTTGSGKSSIIELLTRLYDPTKGKVTIDGVNLKDVAIEELRKNIAVVPQDAFLFSDTIAENIKYGTTEPVTQEQIEEVAKIAAVHHNIIDFPQQYQTILGERGITLSGGQKQRVSIARALIKPSEILVLDDSLSAVDTETEEMILNNLKNEWNRQTVFIITHRVSAAKNADKIMVLNEGRIVEFGSHETLINQEGIYYDLQKKQS